MATELDPGVTANTEAADPNEATSTWKPPRITLKWGNYFRPDADDEQKKVMTATAAHDAGLITKKRAVEKIMPIFGIEAIDAEMDALEEEAAEKQSQDLEAAHALAKLNGPPDDDDEGGGGPGGGKDAPGAFGKRGGGGTSAPPNTPPNAGKRPPPPKSAG